MTNPFYQKSIITTREMQVEDIQLILDTATMLKAKPRPTHLAGKIIGNCFFEPSTRTRLSFQAAAYKLGAHVIGFDNANSTSSSTKGESLSDSMRINALYADLLVVRHPQDGAAKLAAEVANKPVINAGDGANQHPSQTLLDLFSIAESQGTLSGLSIAVVGDLKYSRTVHSLLQACALFRTRFYFVAPESLMLSEAVCDTLRQLGVKYSFHKSIAEVIPMVDIVYMTRLQKERFRAGESATVISSCKLKPACLDKAKDNLRILHPLPRRAELPTSIDSSPYAYYFQQAENGLYVRQALLALCLSEELL